MTLPYASPSHVEGYDGTTSLPITHYVPSLSITFPSYTETLVNVPVLPSMNGAFGIILGTGWFLHRAAVCDFNLRRVILKDSHFRHCTIFCEGSLGAPNEGSFANPLSKDCSMVSWF